MTSSTILAIFHSLCSRCRCRGNSLRPSQAPKVWRALGRVQSWVWPHLSCSECQGHGHCWGASLDLAIPSSAGSLNTHKVLHYIQSKLPPWGSTGGILSAP